MEPYRIFYERYHASLFGHLFRLCGDEDLALDISQESFTRYLQHYGAGESNAALLFRIARNALYDHFRQRKQECPIEGLEMPSGVDPERGVIVRERYRRVVAAMAQLSDRERELLSLVLTQHLKYREIASLADISEANVKVIIHRARKKLQQVLTGDES